MVPTISEDGQFEWPPESGMIVRISDMDRPEPVWRAVPSVQLLPVQLDGRVVGTLSVEAPGVRDEWEMHPAQDELLYLIEGAIDVFLRPELEGIEEEVLHLHQGEACVVPKGMWHRQVVVIGCKMLFLTPETLHRPYMPDSGWSE
jgi:mannose-6-phosphate isomerase-like protein (cupin superfamily)